jgi:predicted RNA-binding protein YlxR (DUF448 family)
MNVFFFLIYLILSTAIGPGVYLASNRNEYQKKKKKKLYSRALPVRRADLTDICEPIVWTVESLTYHYLIGLHGLLRG